MTIQTLGNYGGPPPAAAAPSGEARVAPQAARSEVVAQAVTPTEQPSREQVQKAVEAIKNSVNSTASSSLQFSIDSDTGKTVVRVMDPQSGQTIRQIPSEEVLAMAKALEQQMKGVLIKQQA